MSSSLDNAVGIVAILIGIGILYFLGILVAIAYYILLWLIWQRYRRAALAEFDQAYLEHTAGYGGEDVSSMQFGVRPQAIHSRGIAEVFFGYEVRRR